MGMIPENNSLIRFIRGFYTNKVYRVNQGQLFELDGTGTFWEFGPDGTWIGPLGEARWKTDCEKIYVDWKYLAA